jgi:hypothetical protein
VRGLGIDEGLNVYLAGYIQDSLSFTGLPVMDVDNTGMFVARSGDFNTDISTVSAVTNGISVYPVPSGGHFTIRSGGSFSRVMVVNVLGSVVLDRSIPTAHVSDLDLSDEGVYRIELFDGERRSGIGVVVIAR